MNKLEELLRQLMELVAMAEDGQKTTGTYRRGLRGPVRGLWSGVLDYDQFFDMMVSAIRVGLTIAWTKGARECGIRPDEWSPEEKRQLEQRIQYEYQWIAGLGETTMQNSRAEGGKLKPLYNRLEVWIGRWEGVQSEARTMACADRKFEWVIGPSEQNCSSCSRLNGKVKRGSYWQSRGILPRIHDAPYLECGGWR
jgi:hypothetical protein